MAAQIVASSPEGLTVQITVPFGHSMLDFETRLQQGLNQAGNLATAEQLRRFDTDGSPIQFGATPSTARDGSPRSTRRPTAPSRSIGTSTCPPKGAFP
jgi:hypothetical protein